MPLIKSGSKQAFKKNVETEMRANPGKDSRKQNLAIAYSVQRHNRSKKKMFEGGPVTESLTADSPSVGEDMLEGAPKEHEQELRAGSVRPDVDSQRVRQKYASGGEVNFKDEKRASADDQYQERSQSMRMGAADSHAPEKSWTDDGHTTVDDAKDARDMDMMDDMGHDEQPRADRGMLGVDEADTYRARQMLAEGGSVMEIEHPRSIAEHIRRKEKMKYAEGGEVDLDRNAEEDLNNEDQMSYDAGRQQSYSEEPALKEVEYSDDANMHGDDLEDEDEHGGRIVKAIRGRMKYNKM